MEVDNSTVQNPAQTDVPGQTSGNQANSSHQQGSLESVADNSDNIGISTKCKTGFIVFSVFIIALFILQWLVFSVRWVVQEMICHKTSRQANNSTEGHNTFSFFDRTVLFDIVEISIKILHVPEHIYLLKKLYDFLLSKSEVRCKEELTRRTVAEFVCGRKSCCYSLIFILALVLFMLVAIATPSVHIIQIVKNSSKIFEQCSYNIAVTTLVLLCTLHGILFITNVIIVLDRILITSFTVIIGVIWRKDKDYDHFRKNNDLSVCISNLSAPNIREAKPSGGTNSQLQSNGDQSNSENGAEPELSACVKNLVSVCNEHTKYIKLFREKLELVRPMYKIFRSFFVLQWIIHLFGLFFHISHLFRPWIQIAYGQAINSDTLDVIHHFLFVLFNGLAIGITYICALKMNAYLRRYVRDLQRKQLEAANKNEAAEVNTVQYSLTHLFLIKPDSIPKSNFMPRIPGTGLSISIDNPSFMLSIVISVSAILVSQIAF